MFWTFCSSCMYFVLRNIINHIFFHSLFKNIKTILKLKQNKELQQSAIKKNKNFLNENLPCLYQYLLYLVYFRMATSLPQEDIHFLRLDGLLIRVAPRVVRRRFDYEFHPGQLKQFISRNRRKIYDLTYKKRVITLVQYDLLFPKGNIPRY